MFTRKWLIAISLLTVFSMLLAACGTTATTEAPAQEPVTVVETVEVVTTVEVITTVEVEKTVEVMVEVTPTAQPTTRKGGWVDQLVFTEQNSAQAAVTQLQAGELDMYAYSVGDPELLKNVQADPTLTSSNSYGSTNELTFNPAVCLDPATGEVDATKLNPFSNPKVREAINYIIDRSYIVQEINGGLGTSKWLPVNSAFPDYARYVDTIRAIEGKYAFNPEIGKQLLDTELTAMGATVGSDGKFSFNGAPLSVAFIIRTEDERKEIGDYVSNQFEAAGFTVDRQYKTRSEASPIWVQGNPSDCLFNVYTGGWITTSIDRDEGDGFSFYYTPNDYPIPLFQAYTPTEEFNTVALRLRNNDFTTIAERDELFKQAFNFAILDSVRLWLVDGADFSPRRANTTVAYDLSGGIAGSLLYPLTARFTGQEGGVLRIAQPGVLVDPWNPLGGSNWIYDSMPIRATYDNGVIPNPHTGLNMPQRVEKVELTVKEGLPVTQNPGSEGWLTLTTAPSIEVPGDAIVDWNAETQTFITAAEKYTETQTAASKSVVYYPASLWTDVKWHDGSPLTMADFVMGMILTFDPGKEASPIYDEALAAGINAFLDHFKGVKVISTDPLVIETYDDLYQLYAENNVTTWWPNYGYGPGAWHNLAVGNQAVASGELALTADKAEADEVEWMSYISGPSLDILKAVLDTAQAENLIPYAPTMGTYVTADEATARWANLQTWFAARNNFWLGTGAYYVYQVYPVEGTLVLQRYTEFPDLANKWDRFGTPQVPVVSVDGPGQVNPGEEATFDVFVTFKEQPYPAANIAAAKYLVFDAIGNLVAQGDLTLVSDGVYQAVLSADVTTPLTSGAYKLEAAAVSSTVSIPGFGSFEFIVP